MVGGHTSASGKIKKEMQGNEKITTNKQAGWTQICWEYQRSPKSWQFSTFRVLQYFPWSLFACFSSSRCRKGKKSGSRLGHASGQAQPHVRGHGSQRRHSVPSSLQDGDGSCPPPPSLLGSPVLLTSKPSRPIRCPTQPELLDAAVLQAVQK